MTVRWTIERILRDDDDASGQTLRSWRLERDGEHISIGRSEHSDANLIRRSGVPQLIADLQALAEGKD